eukprot:Colp12_sorted_trinity150504_noHs@14160
MDNLRKSKLVEEATDSQNNQEVVALKQRLAAVEKEAARYQQLYEAYKAQRGAAAQHSDSEDESVSAEQHMQVQRECDRLQQQLKEAQSELQKLKDQPPPSNQTKPEGLEDYVELKLQLADKEFALNQSTLELKNLHKKQQEDRANMKVLTEKLTAYEVQFAAMLAQANPKGKRK